MDYILFIIYYSWDRKSSIHSSPAVFFQNPHFFRQKEKRNRVGSKVLEMLRHTCSTGCWICMNFDLVFLNFSIRYIITFYQFRENRKRKKSFYEQGKHNLNSGTPSQGEWQSIPNFISFVSMADKRCWGGEKKILFSCEKKKINLEKNTCYGLWKKLLLNVAWINGVALNIQSDYHIDWG